MASEKREKEPESLKDIPKRRRRTTYHNDAGMGRWKRERTGSTAERQGMEAENAMEAPVIYAPTLVKRPP